MRDSYRLYSVISPDANHNPKCEMESMQLHDIPEEKMIILFLKKKKITNLAFQRPKMHSKYLHQNASLFWYLNKIFEYVRRKMIRIKEY